MAGPGIVAAKARELVARADLVFFSDEADSALVTAASADTTGKVVDDEIPEELYALILSAMQRLDAGPDGTATLSEIVEVERYYPRIWLSALSPAGQLSWPAPSERSPEEREVGLERGSAGPEVLGSVSIPTSSRAIMSKASAGLQDIEQVFAACAVTSEGEDHCNAFVPAAWRSVLQGVRALPALTQVGRINSEVNARIAYRPDTEAGGRGDRWAPARETIKRSAGDCEDFAILKMWLLAGLGFAPNDMYVVVVRAADLSTQHAVLAVRIDGETYILDNRVNRVVLASGASTYIPVFSVNTSSAWLHGFSKREAVAAAAGAKTSPIER